MTRNHMKAATRYPREKSTRSDPSSPRPTPTEYQSVNDSGVRQEFDTGSRRDSRDGKGRFDLISPFMLQRLAKHYENGAKKYGDHNWRKGQPLSRYLDSAMRHILNWQIGMRDEDHLTAAIWNLAAILDHEIMISLGHLPDSLNDIPDGIQIGSFVQTKNQNESLRRKPSSFGARLLMRIADLVTRR